MTDQQFIDWLRDPTTRRVALVEAIARISGSETTLYLSNIPFSSGSGDTPANTVYESCIVGGVTFSESLNLDGSPSISYGAIEVENRGGHRDEWLDHVWANRQIKIFMGDATWERDDFRQIFEGVVDDLGTNGPEALTLILMDKLQRLNNPLSETLLGGATDNKDKLVPLTFGEVSNIEPLLSNPPTLEYQVHGGPIENIIEVRDNGVPVTVTKSLSTGKFTLSASPAGQITCSVQGDKPSAYANNISELVQRLAIGYGPSHTKFSSGDLDSTNLDAFELAFPQVVGFYASDRENVLEVCQNLAASVGAQVVVNTLGKLRLVQLDLPAAGTPTEITAEDFEYHSLSVSERPKVKATCKLGYCRNWTMQDSGLAGGLPTSSVALFKDEWMDKVSTDAGVATIYKLDAQPVREETLLQVESEAAAEAERRRDLWKTPRAIYSFRGFSHLMLTELGDPMTITHDRFGLASGKTGMVVGIERDWLAGRVTIGVLA